MYIRDKQCIQLVEIFPTMNTDFSMLFMCRCLFHRQQRENSCCIDNLLYKMGRAHDKSSVSDKTLAETNAIESLLLQPFDI